MTSMSTQTLAGSSSRLLEVVGDAVAIGVMERKDGTTFFQNI